MKVLGKWYKVKANKFGYDAYLNGKLVAFATSLDELELAILNLE